MAALALHGNAGYGDGKRTHSPGFSRAQPLPPIPDTPPSEHRGPQALARYSTVSGPVLYEQQVVDHLQSRVAAAERSTRVLLKQALEAQTDIDESFQLSRDARRGEKQQRDLLKEHIRSITFVVKTLSREMDVVEENLLGTIGHVRHSVRKLEKSQADSDGKSGWTRQQQEHVNLQIKDAVHAMMGEHRLFQSRVVDEVRKVNVRLDELGHQVTGLQQGQDNHQASQERYNARVEGELGSLRNQGANLEQQLLTLTADLSVTRSWAEGNERDLKTLKSNLADFSRNIASTIEDEHKHHASERKGLEAVLRSGLEAEIQAATHARDDLAEQLRGLLELQGQSFNESLTDMHDKLSAKLSCQREALDLGLQELEQGLREAQASLQSAIRASGDTARSEVRDVGETLNMLSALLSQKVDQLEAKVAQILKTVVVI